MLPQHHLSELSRNHFSPQVQQLVYNIIMNVLDYSIGTEKLVDPIKVGTVHKLQKSLNKLPTWIQRRIVIAASEKASKMGFIVEPYAFFLAYEIDEIDLAKVATHLPKNFTPAKCAIFKGDAPKYYGIISIYRIHASVFWGSRIEAYIIAKNEETGLLSWVILDYVSDTISYDEKSGLRSPDAEQAVVTTTCEGDFITDIKRKKSAAEKSRPANLKVIASLNNAKMRPLDEQLWIEGNTSICYSREIAGDDGDLFSLTFLPEEMKQAWDIPLRDVEEAKVSWFKEVFGGKLGKAVCFPFAQHMLSDSPSTRTHYGSAAALRKAAEEVNFSKISVLNK